MATPVAPGTSNPMPRWSSISSCSKPPAVPPSDHARQQAGAMLASPQKSPAMRGLFLTCRRLPASDDLDHFQALVRVAPLVVVPADQLDEVVVERDAGFGVEDRGARVAAEIGGDDLVLGV